jgi:putative ATP-binding cassette transporter
MEQELRPSVETHMQLRYSARIRMIAADTLTRLSFFLLLGLLVFVMPGLLGIESEVLNGYILMALFLYRPLSAMMGRVTDFGIAAVSADKIERMGLALDTYGMERFPPETVSAPSWQSLKLERVTFTYFRENQDRPFTVGPIDMEFRPGEIVFLLGGNGSGKTTLAKVLTTLYPVQSGRILLDHEEVTTENQEAYRQLFSAIFSDFHLFGSLINGGEGDLDALAAEYLKQLELNHTVEVDQGQFSTTDLSSGQRRRLALLEAYLEDRPFYVFDEWAADQDPRFKEIFYTEILQTLKSQGKTVLVITHDDRYIGVADRCFKLADGKLEECRK